MSLVIFIVFALTVLSIFVGFVILELHPRWRRSGGNVMKFMAGSLIFTAAAWTGLYFLSNRGNTIFDNVLDIVVIFLTLIVSILGGGMVFVKLFGRH